VDRDRAGNSSDVSSAYLLVVIAVVVVPGADFVVTLRNTVAGGRGAGTATALGVGAASVVQGTLVSLGVGALIVASQPVLTALRWIGLAYLGYLGVQALWSAWRGRYEAATSDPGSGHHARAARQGFLTNITNPKMLVFYLSLLPQFVGADAGPWPWLLHAWTLPVIGTAWLLAIAVFGSVVREELLRPVVRRVVDTVSGLALIGFGARLALDRG
jgi:threonine/homoserine/homoserine lactone efflux protein